MKVLEEQLVFHQELDVRTVETTEIEKIFGQKERQETKWVLT